MKKSWYNRFQTFAMNRMVSPSLMEEDSLLYWRVRILFSILFAASILSLITFIPVTILVFKNNLWGLGLFDAAAWLIALTLLLARNIRFETRSAIASVLTYLVGLVIIIHIGFLSGGTICLFGFAVLAGIFKGTKAVTGALAVNAITLIITGWFISTGRFGRTFPFFKTTEAMMAAGATFMLINAVIAISVMALVKGLAKTNQKQKVLVINLESEHSRLENTRIMLELEVEKQKQAEKALKESEERYRDLVENATDLIVTYDLKGTLLSVNAAAVRASGLAAEELVGVCFLDLIPRDRRHEFDAYIEAIHLKGAAAGTMKFVTRDGEVRFLEYHSSLRTEGVPAPVVRAIARDVTEKVMVKKALVKSEKRYRMLFERNLAGVYRTTLDGSLLDCNDAFARIYGYGSREEALQHPVVDFHVSPEVRQEFIAALQIRGAFMGYERQGRRKDGSLIWLSENASMVPGENGALSEIEGTLVDISDRRRAEEEKAYLEDQNRQLQKAESLGRMAGAIAHHFNNQLAVVMGNLELAMGKMPYVEGPVINLTEAMQSARKAAKMSGMMLTYLGQTPVKREPLDLSEIFRKSLTMLRDIMPKEVVLNTDLPSHGPTISADATQVQQVITNLVTNAWEAMDDNRGSIKLTVKTVSMPDIKAVHSFPVDWKPLENDYACVEVADPGCGIAAKDIEKLFDPFFSSKFTGRGLGLAVVLGIMKSHGGAVTVESEPGQGSIFRAFFPISKQLPLLFRQQEKADESPGLESGAGILLVEDEAAVRKMAKSMLTFMGYIVYEAKDGVDAVDVFRQKKEEIRCVLCDLTMPRLDGWGTLIALRKLDPGIPVIMVSGFDREEVMAGDHSEWPQVFLNKPYELNELSDTIRRAVAKKT
ncbi:MAG: PAS domain S-box protein [Desulfobacterales bacterium]|nr:PAS domain S-box protein [Desulfobacterales bacterium]